MNNSSNNIVELLDEGNNKLVFEHLMTLDYKNSEYIVLSPLNQIDDETEESDIVILRVEQDDNNDDVYMAIEDKNELFDVFEAVNEIYTKGYGNSNDIEQ